jgi:hypothetical protein
MAGQQPLSLIGKATALSCAIQRDSWSGSGGAASVTLTGLMPGPLVACCGLLTTTALPDAMFNVRSGGAGLGLAHRVASLGPWDG